MSDPSGSLKFIEHKLGVMRRYKFGLQTADFIICSKCGVYVGAQMQLSERTYGIVNVRVLKNYGEFTKSPQPTFYNNETSEERIERRRTRWTPSSK